MNAPAVLPEWLKLANAEAVRRFEAVNWQQGKWYAIYDEDEGSYGTAITYQCEIDAEGDVYLIEEMCMYDKQQGHEPRVYEGRGFITSGSVVVPQN